MPVVVPWPCTPCIELEATLRHLLLLDRITIRLHAAFLLFKAANSICLLSSLAFVLLPRDLDGLLRTISVINTT